MMWRRLGTVGKAFGVVVGATVAVLVCLFALSPGPSLFHPAPPPLPTDKPLPTSSADVSPPRPAPQQP